MKALFPAICMTHSLSVRQRARALPPARPASLDEVRVKQEPRDDRRSSGMFAPLCFVMVMFQFLQASSENRSRSPHASVHVDDRAAPRDVGRTIAAAADHQDETIVTVGDSYNL